MHRRILDILSAHGDPHIGDRQWLAISNPALNSLMHVSRAALDAAEARAKENLIHERRDLLMALLLMALSIGLATVALAIVFSRVILPLGAITRAMTSGKEEDIEAVLALRARSDEIGLLARALKAQRQGAAECLRLDAARKAAEAASRVKSEFLANMSHELRTPLNAVIGFSELMVHKTFGPLSEQYEEYAGLINEAGTHLLSLMSDILDLAKIEAGRFAPDFSEVDLKKPARQCLTLVRRRAEERSITVSSRLPDGEVMVEADARAMKQILLNLLSNAVKFSRDGGAITLSLRAGHDCVEIKVRDEGIGIPADLLARIGQPFEQASNNPMLAREGTGLGLALVTALVAEHRGRLAVTSKENVGTEFTVVLPRRQEPRASRAA
ncbi:MAG TPA: HAMP domain-containing sensor histidine kinase [Rhizomicrobium sp.]|nr:HAMP domain-containing sensor histidine kinase [Rhizomicrobium sp.]